jgi:dihydrofolate synthase/folylpolyglutamate synthase
MDYSQALDYLLSFADFERSGRFRSRPDLAPMRALLHHLDDPQGGRPTVHIAGSKGKGSTAAMIASVLRESGLTVGLYTSPHLHSFCERIEVDGEPIDRETFARHVERLPPLVVKVNQQFPDRELVTFDLLTATGFLAFREAGVTLQVIETGLGGRLDSTNALDDKEVCVITAISREHTAILGETVRRIAEEKAGIIGRGSTVVMGLQSASAAAVIRRTCGERGADLVEVARSCVIERYEHTLDGQDFRLQTAGGSYDLHLPLLGLHQLENAAAAVSAVEALARHGLAVSPEQIRRGLAGVRWPGRLEILRRRPLLIVDGAHSAEAVRRLRETLLQDMTFSKAILIVGASSDKEIGAMAAELEPLEATVIATSAHNPRAAPAPVVAAAFSNRGIPTTVTETVPQAVESALAQAEPDDLICVLGSLFVVAEARAYILGIEGDPPTG